MMIIHRMSGRSRVKKAISAITDWRLATPAQKLELLNAIEQSRRIRDQIRFGTPA